MRPPLAALALAFTAAAAPALAYDYSPAAQAVLTQARNATGGAGWNSLRGWQESGTWGAASYQLQVDPVRYGVRIEVRNGSAVRTHGFNGAGDWETASYGDPTGYVDRYSVAQGRTLAFFAAWGFYFPSRFAAKGTHVGVRQYAGRSYDVLRIEPMGGLARELWFDRSSHLLTRMIDRNGTAPVTYELSDYRRIGAVKAPFHVSIDGGDPARPQTRQVRAVAFAPADRAQFSLVR